MDIANVYTINSDLTSGNADNLSAARHNLSGGQIEEYAGFFGGGAVYISNYSTLANSYDSSLTRQIMDDMVEARSDAAISAIARSLFVSSGQDDEALIDVYDSSQTHNTSVQLSAARNYASSAATSSHLVVGGGTQNGEYVGTVDAFDTSFSRTQPSPFSVPRSYYGGGSVGEYCLFAGGRNGSESYLSSADAYNDSLTQVSVDEISVPGRLVGVMSLPGYVLFNAQTASSSENGLVVTAYDDSLTRTIPPELGGTTSGWRCYASFGNYAFARRSSAVEIYTVQ